LHEAARDRESESRAALSVATRPSPERLEDPTLLVRRNSRTVIGDAHDNVVSDLVGAQLDPIRGR
jgi:hypothetical protein